MKPIEGIPMDERNDRRLDLLVDGELNENDRRELLCGLDGEPDGWRRCAIAFLEAQAWKQAVGAMFRPAAQAEAKPRAAKTADWRRRVEMALAIAASFFVALAVGMHLRSGGSNLAARTGSLGGMTPAMTRVSPPGPGGVQQFAQPAASLSPLQTVALTARGADGKPHTFALSAVEGDRITEAWIRDLPTPVPPAVLQALTASGQQVQQRRILVPVQMPDGRRLVVPVDEVKIHFVGRPTL